MTLHLQQVSMELTGCLNKDPFSRTITELLRAACVSTHIISAVIYKIYYVFLEIASQVALLFIRKSEKVQLKSINQNQVILEFFISVTNAGVDDGS